MNIMTMGMLGARTAVFIIGLIIIIFTLISAIKTFVVPRGINVWITREVFHLVGILFRAAAWRARSYEERDEIMALYAPVTLVLMPVIMLLFIQAGFMLLFWATEPRPLYDLFEISGSSLLTLGSEEQENFLSKILEFSEATIGLILIALLIAYLPTMYSAFSRRETAVSIWDARAGSPPSVEEMVARSFRTGELTNLRDEWISWETWFAEIEESHTSLAPLAYFRSPVHNRSWVTASGSVLDCASFILTAVDIPFESKAAFCLRSGFLALQQIAHFHNIPFNPHPSPTDPISISRSEFDEVCHALIAQGVPMRTDLDDAWRNFCGWRVNYDAVLLQLSALTMAPYALWISDRSPLKPPPPTRPS